MIPGHESEPNIAIVLQPIVVKMVAQPLAPRALHGHPGPDRQDGEEKTGSGQRHEAQRLNPEIRSIPAADRIEEIAVPEIQPVLRQ